MALIHAIGLGLIAGKSAAQIPGPPGQHRQVTADELVDVRVITDRTRVGPGETFHVLAVFDIKRPWHLYWKNPGEAGALPPSVDVVAPEGFSIGEILWPRPKRLNNPAGEMFCYENQLALFIPVTAPAELDDGEVALETSIRYAVCDANRCLFGQTVRRPRIRTTSDSTGEAADRLSRRDADLIERHLPRLPRVISDAEGGSIALHDEQLTITIPAHGHDRAAFFPLNAPGVTFGEANLSFNDDSLTVTVALRINPRNLRGGPPKVGGLVTLGPEPDGPSYEGSIALTP
jgi:DsbC/DsbD-like thiol-disulfide interchange protein